MPGYPLNEVALANAKPPYSQTTTYVRELNTHVFDMRNSLLSRLADVLPQSEAQKNEADLPPPRCGLHAELQSLDDALQSLSLLIESIQL